ncbi:unnamed protein product [Arctia plantaginis]|uniref:Uncharacterized protein n=1 Tax=Arctia plantaginis TaxID=874455 RepID=A0A8S1A4H4_ARCPL|nr:unnamed protein product [Arctia plantaginis]
MKKNARKELSQEKKERRCTGGGPPPPKPSDTSEWLCSIMGESIVGLPSTHDSDFIFDNNTPQLNGEAAQPSVALSNIEEEMSMVSYTDGHNDGVIHDVAHIVPIHDVQENEETRETVKFDTSTPHTMLRKPLSKPLGPVITFQDTTFRRAIPAEERLTVTLRYLATGASCFEYLIGATTLRNIVNSTCQSIWEAKANLDSFRT